MDREVLARMLDAGLSLEAIARRVGRHPSTVGYWVRKHGLVPVHRGRHAARGGLSADALRDLVARHLTVREIATELDRSPATVRHWLRRHGLETTREARLRAKREAVGDRFDAVCERHGQAEFVIRRDGTSSCVHCRVESVSARRRRVKQRLVDEAGGRCALCGYDRCVGALHFHHRDPREKRFALAGRGITLALEELRKETAKCVLLCANCHAEVEAGTATLNAPA